MNNKCYRYVETSRLVYIGRWSVKPSKLQTFKKDEILDPMIVCFMLERSVII